MKKQTKSRYRIKSYDPVHNIYILQKRVFWFFWYGVSAGPKQELQDFITAHEISVKDCSTLPIINN